MTNFLKTFFGKTDGAVTVDWVVLTAATVSLALLVFTVINVGVNDKVGDVTASIEATE